MCIKFQVHWTSNSSKSTLTKNFNLKLALSFSMFSTQQTVKLGQKSNLALK